MIKVIEDRGEEGIFVTIQDNSIAIKDLTGGELTASEVLFINSVYPDLIPSTYAIKVVAPIEDEPIIEDEPTIEE
jgi:hypothetical protein